MLGDGRFNIRYQQLAANAVEGKQWQMFTNCSDNGDSKCYIFPLLINKCKRQANH